MNKGFLTYAAINFPKNSNAVYSVDKTLFQDVDNFMLCNGEQYTTIGGYVKSIFDFHLKSKFIKDLKRFAVISKLLACYRYKSFYY